MSTDRMFLALVVVAIVFSLFFIFFDLEFVAKCNAKGGKTFTTNSGYTCISERSIIKLD